MFDNLPTSVIPANEEELLSAFGDADDTKDKGGKGDQKPASLSKTDGPGDTKKPVVDTKKTKPSSKENTGLGKTSKAITDFSDEEKDVFGDEEDENDEDTEDDKPKTSGAGKNEEDETDEETDDTDKNSDEEDEEDDNNAGGNDSDQASIKDFLKSRAEFLVKNGEWADWEGREDEEWSEDRFAEIELDQRNYAKQQLTEQILDEFGPIGRTIAEYTKNGGDPDQLIDIFKEQRRVDSLSIDTEENQIDVIKKYEVEFLGKKPERVKKYIDSLIADKELAAASKEAKEAMEESLQQQAIELQEAQKLAAKQQQQKVLQNLQNFSSTITAAINGKDIPDSEKETLIKVLTKFDKRLPNGSPVNAFYDKFADFKKDPNNYVDLVRFVLNPDAFRKALKTEGKNTATDKAFKLARSSNKTRSVKSADTFTPDNSGGRGKAVTKFKLL